MTDKDNDIELLAGLVWNAPDRPHPVLSPEARAWLQAQGDTIPTLGEAPWLRPQAEIVRHPIPPHLSENTHEAPHYGDILPHKEKP